MSLMNGHWWKLRTHFGVEKVTNGIFAADTDWTKGDGWSIAAGVASSDGSQAIFGELSQAETKIVGAFYRYIYTVTAYSAGSINIRYGNTTYGTPRSSTGTYVEIIRQSEAYHFNTIVADATFVGSIDNFSVREMI